MFRKVMSMSQSIKLGTDFDLENLAPNIQGMANHWAVPWDNIRASHAGGIFMRPLFTFTPQLDPHFNCLLVLHGTVILLDTWEGLSKHTVISLAFHTVQNGRNRVLKVIRVQLPKQGNNKQCWSRLLVYMARLARHIKDDSNLDDVIEILADTVVPLEI